MTKENAIQKKDNNKHDFLVMCKPIHLKIQSIFDYLNNSPNKLLDFNELPDKEKDIYSPLLKAFINEIKRQYVRQKNLPKKLVKHLLGKYDFYKIVYIDKEQNTQIRFYNLHATFETINQAQETAIIIPTASLPTRIIHLDFAPNNPNTIELYMNKGWQFIFRIHNTKNSIKPSLVFDIELIGIPITLTTSTC